MRAGSEGTRKSKPPLSTLRMLHDMNTYIPHENEAEKQAMADQRNAINLKLPPHKCSLTIEHNPHKAVYQKLDEYIENGLDMTWKDEESIERAIAANELWVIQWYPDTPVGCCVVAAPTLWEALALANK